MVCCSSLKTFSPALRQDEQTGYAVLTLVKGSRPVSMFSVLLKLWSAACLVKDYRALKHVFCKSVLGFLCHVTVGWVSEWVCAVVPLYVMRGQHTLLFPAALLFVLPNFAAVAQTAPKIFLLFLWQMHWARRSTRRPYRCSFHLMFIISSPAAFLTQTVCLDDTTVKFEIWDTAGQERYHSLAPMYYRGAQAAIVVYDITNTVSSRTVAGVVPLLTLAFSLGLMIS